MIISDSTMILMGFFGGMLTTYFIAELTIVKNYKELKKRFNVE